MVLALQSVTGGNSESLWFSESRSRQRHHHTHTPKQILAATDANTAGTLRRSASHAHCGGVTSDHYTHIVPSMKCTLVAAAACSAALLQLARAPTAAAAATAVRAPRFVYDAQVLYKAPEPAISIMKPVGQGHSPCNYTFNPAWLEPQPGNPGLNASILIFRAAECPEEYGGVVSGATLCV
jgi:hypothetical protein